MISLDDRHKLETLRGNRDLIPLRLRDHDPFLVAMLLESGRQQRFLKEAPWGPEGYPHDEIANTVRQLRWEGFVDIAREDVDGDEIPDDVLLTGWTTNETGMVFLRTLRVAAGIE